MHFLKQKRKIILVMILLTLIGVYFYISQTKNYSDSNRINMGIQAMSNMVKEDGRITYKINFLTNKQSKKNNIVREMGSAYAIAFAYHQTGDKKLQQQLIRIFNTARNRCLKTGKNACMISDNPEKIKLGATALALVAELFYEKASGDKQFADMREKWVNAIMLLYEKGKGLHISPKKSETSPYFDGEGWFALSVYHDMHPEQKQVAQSLLSMDQTILDIYQNKYLNSFVHWGLMAGAQRYHTTREARFLNFLKKQFQLYVQENPAPRKGSSTCAVTEGLGDVAFFVGKDDPNFTQQVLGRISENTPTIYDLQVISEKITGPEVKKYPTIHPGTRKYIGAFKNTPNTYKTRNDISQHCLIALLKRHRVFKNNTPDF